MFYILKVYVILKTYLSFRDSKNVRDFLTRILKCPIRDYKINIIMTNKLFLIY